MRRIRRWLLGLMLIGAAALPVLLLYPKDRSLLSQSTKVADVHTWSIRRIQDNEIGGYHWLANGDALFFRDAGSSWHHDFRIFRWNRAAQTETTLPALTRLFAKWHSFPWLIDVSPDGNWMLWPTDGGKIHIARLDGTHALHSPAQQWPEARWMGDSRHWAELVRGLHGKYGPMDLRVHDIESPASEQTISITPIQRWNNFACTTRRQLLEKPYGIWMGNKSVLTIGETRFDLNTHPRRLFTIRLPSGAQVREMEFAPTGDRIAWKFAFLRTSKLSLWLHRWLSATKIASVHSVELWTSRLDGGDMHPIGHYDIPPGTKYGLEPYDIHWLPDGKQISFVCRNALWTVPADGR